MVSLFVPGYSVPSCFSPSEGFQSWMWRGLTFLLPFLFFGHVSCICVPVHPAVQPLLWLEQGLCFTM